MRHRLLLVLTALLAMFALFAGGRTFAESPPSAPPVTTPTTAAGAVVGATSTTLDTHFLDTKRDISQCISSNPLPDCGIAPSKPGDPGGVLQGVTFGVLALGIAVICWRVVVSVRARDAANGSRAVKPPA